MAVRYYDEAILYKLNKWIPEASNLRVLKPEETRKLFELTANDNNDKPFELPLIALSRNTDISLLSTVKQSRSFDGLKIAENSADLSALKGDNYRTAINSIPDASAQLNVIPIQVQYQLDIYTKTQEDGDEYLRSFLFKLINNPVIKIYIPYNGTGMEHIANIRVLDTVSDTSSISERIFSGQFTRWTIQFEIQDAFLFNIPFRKNWKLDGVTFEAIEDSLDSNKIVDSETYTI